jgi:hypothetical protein
MHFSQGGVEIADLRRDKDSSVLRGICTRPKGEQGHLYILLPAGWAPADFRELYTVQEVTHDLDRRQSRESVLKGDYLVKERTGPGDTDQEEKMIIALLRLDFQQETTDFALRFERF